MVRRDIDDIRSIDDDFGSTSVTPAAPHDDDRRRDVGQERIHLNDPLVLRIACWNDQNAVATAVCVTLQNGPAQRVL